MGKKAFRPRARLLALLGEQLIDNARLAVFEMVKNSYDADANQVAIRLVDPDKIGGSISVHDDGSGMTLEHSPISGSSQGPMIVTLRNWPVSGVTNSTDCHWARRESADLPRTNLETLSNCGRAHLVVPNTK